MGPFADGEAQMLITAIILYSTKRIVVCATLYTLGVFGIVYSVSYVHMQKHAIVNVFIIMNAVSIVPHSV